MRLSALIVSFLMMSTYSINAQKYQLSKPVVNVEGSDLFQKNAKVTLDFRLEGASLYYTLDGDEPTQQSKQYKRPFSIKESSILKVKAFKDGFNPSETVITHLLKVGEKIPAIEVLPLAKPPYAGNAGETLIDQKAGSLNFRDGHWLGYNQGPITFILDLGKQKSINEITVSTLNSPDAWIMSPTSIKGYTSDNGEDYVVLQTLTIPVLNKDAKSAKAYYTLETPNQTCRYVKLVIQPLGGLPLWHPGKGNSAWVFLDEIIIK